MNLEQFTRLLFATFATKKNPYEINGNPFIPGNFLDILDKLMKEKEIKDSLKDIIDLNYYEYNHDGFQNELATYMNGFIINNQPGFDFTYNYVTYKIDDLYIKNILEQFSEEEKNKVSYFIDLVIDEVLNIQTTKQLEYSSQKDLQLVLKKYRV